MLPCGRDGRGTSLIGVTSTCKLLLVLAMISLCECQARSALPVRVLSAGVVTGFTHREKHGDELALRTLEQKVAVKTRPPEAIDGILRNKRRDAVFSGLHMLASHHLVCILKPGVGPDLVG